MSTQISQQIHHFLGSRVAKTLLIPALIILYAAVVRVPYWFDGTIPFQFDHGKDMLAVLHMIKTYSPALIGPWTSIPGLFFGPGWYYLLAPATVLGGLSPVAPVALMTVLVLIQIYLAYRFFGKTAALLMSAAPFWITISNSAWNPFPMTFVTLLIVLLLLQVLKEKQLGSFAAFGLGAVAAAGFHFSAAFAIFYPVIILALLLIWKVRLPVRSILLGFFGAVILFLPQLAFEVRHDFVQSKAVVAYFQAGESHAVSGEKVREVLQTFVGEARSAVIPGNRLLPSGIEVSITTLLFLFTIVVVAWSYPKNNKVKLFTHLLGVAAGVSLFGFFFLHFNVWYVYALMPLVVFVVAAAMDTLPRWLYISLVVVILVNPIANLVQFKNENRAELRESSVFLPAKRQALDLIREKAAGRPFASYHFLPDVYDFPYQYLYFVDAERGLPLPVEFSYKPNAIPYITQKQELLPLYPVQQGEAELIFYIIEEPGVAPESQETYKRWWGDQEYGQVIEEVAITPQVLLRVATPATAEAELTDTE